MRVLLGFAIGTGWSQPFALQDLDALQNVVQRQGLEPSQFDKFPYVCTPLNLSAVDIVPYSQCLMTSKFSFPPQSAFGITSSVTNTAYR